MPRGCQKKLQTFVLTASLQTGGDGNGRKYGENGGDGNCLTVSRFADTKTQDSLSDGTERTVSRRRRGFFMLRKSTFHVTGKPLPAPETAHMAYGKRADGFPTDPKKPHRHALRAQNESAGSTSFVKIYYRHSAHPLPRALSPRAPIL